MEVIYTPPECVPSSEHFNLFTLSNQPKSMKAIAVKIVRANDQESSNRSKGDETRYVI